MTKTTYYLPLGIFLLANLCKLMHWPGGNILMILIFFIQLTFAIIHIFKARKELTAIERVLPFCLSTIYLYLVFDLLYWPGSVAQFLFAIVFSLTILIIALIKTKRFGLGVKLTGAFFVLAIFLFLTPAHRQYKFYGEFFGNDEERAFFYWDRYSWFLYLDNQFQEALDANQKAIDLECAGSIENSFCNDLKDSRKKIENQTWDEFDYSNKDYRYAKRAYGYE